MYLGTAELDRLKLFNPPERTPEIFERYLPYALALDLENEWVAQFSTVLAGAAVAGAGVYQPAWLDGSVADWDWDTTGSAIGGVGDALGRTIASAATPPGSSSGLSMSGSSDYSGGGYAGGGFSGGGGGGGGGGGW